MNTPNHRAKFALLCYFCKTNVLFRTLSYAIVPSMKNVIFHCLHAVGVGTWLRSQKHQQVTVLSLHRVSSDFDPVWNPMKPATFEKLLQYISIHYEVVRFSQLNDMPKTGKPRLVLSFDDGYLDFMEFAFPLLQRYGLPCNHNFVTDCLDHRTSIWTQDVNKIIRELHQSRQSHTLTLAGNDYTIDPNLPADSGASVQLLHALLATPRAPRLQAIRDWQQSLGIAPDDTPLMAWDDVRLCHASGLVEVGSHTTTHDSMPTIDHADVLRYELEHSKTRLEQELGAVVDIIALPNGQTNSTIREAVQKAGYNWLLEVGDDCYTHCATQSPHVVPRINMIEESEVAMRLRIEQFHKKLKKMLGRS